MYNHIECSLSIQTNHQTQGIFHISKTFPPPDFVESLVPNHHETPSARTARKKSTKGEFTSCMKQYYWMYLAHQISVFLDKFQEERGRREGFFSSHLYWASQLGGSTWPFTRQERSYWRQGSHDSSLSISSPCGPGSRWRSPCWSGAVFDETLVTRQICQEDVANTVLVANDKWSCRWNGNLAGMAGVYNIYIHTWMYYHASRNRKPIAP